MSAFSVKLRGASRVVTVREDGALALRGNYHSFDMSPGEELDALHQVAALLLPGEGYGGVVPRLAWRGQTVSVGVNPDGSLREVHLATEVKESVWAAIAIPTGERVGLMRQVVAALLRERELLATGAARTGPQVINPSDWDGGDAPPTEKPPELQNPARGDSPLQRLHEFLHGAGLYREAELVDEARAERDRLKSENTMGSAWTRALMEEAGFTWSGESPATSVMEVAEALRAQGASAAHRKVEHERVAARDDRPLVRLVEAKDGSNVIVDERWAAYLTEAIDAVELRAQVEFLVECVNRAHRERGQ